MSFKRTTIRLAAVLACCSGFIAHGGEAELRPSATRAQGILKATGVKGGLVVHLGCGDR